MARGTLSLTSGRGGPLDIRGDRLRTSKDAWRGGGRSLTRALGATPLSNTALRRRALALLASSAVVALGAAAHAEAPGEAAASQPSPTQAPTPTAGGEKGAPDIAEVVVNGVPFRETVLPTRLSSSSTYGLDLSVLDTPRNTTLLSTTQLETVNIQDPRAFSFLTSSSYTDSSFGTPNIPRIRGQYADVFYNGMRDSFTQNGYGAPINFDAFQNISITKGPASVIDGPGADVGGEVDFLTKRPNLNRDTISASATFDTVGNRRWTIDAGGPIIKDNLGILISYSGEDSSSYFTGHYLDRNAVYVAVRWNPNDRYSLDFNTELNVEQYTEDVGVNRVNQSLINSGTYLQGGPDGVEYDSSAFGANNGVPIPTGLAAGTGNPYTAAPVLTEINLTNSVRLNPKITIDETPGTSSRALLYNAQLIQTFHFTGDVTLENNTFFAYQDSDNQEGYYYADASRGSWTLENRTDVKINADLPFSLSGDGAPVKNQFIAGGTVRYAYTNYISDFSAETASVYDLTGNPALWVFNPAYQALADAFTYTTSFGRTQFGVPGRDVTGNGNTGISGLWDTGLFFQDRVSFTPQWSLLFGGRIDAVQNHSYDPLGGAVCANCFTDNLPQSHTTGVYGLGDANFSLVYRPHPWVSGYVTFDWTQSVNPNGGEGGVNAFGQVPDILLMRQTSYLYEAGLKFNLLNNKLFAGMAVFDQKRNVPTGYGGTVPDAANIRGVELEMNYQPNRNLYVTASYSYIDTTLSAAPQFYDYPAEPGINVDGAGLLAVFEPGQKFQDPGIPQHVFNLLGNYKFDNGLGVRSGLQVTGPINLIPSGQLDLAASGAGGLVPLPSEVLSANGYLKSPVIPWQFTWNASVFYEWSRYTITLSVYNLTDQRNWQPSPTLYGDDFLVLDDPRTFEVRLQAKF